MKKLSVSFKYIFIGLVIVFIIALSANYYVQVKEQKQLFQKHRAFFEYIDTNIIGDFFESITLTRESAQINDALRYREDYLSEDYLQAQGNQVGISAETVERLKRSQGYLDTLETHQIDRLEEFKLYLSSAISFSLESAEADGVRINHIYCVLTRQDYELISKCDLSEEEKASIESHQAKFGLSLDEYRKFRDQSIDYVIGNSQCDECLVLLYEWDSKFSSLAKEAIDATRENLP